MSIIASCGHKVEVFDACINIATKAWGIDEEGWHKAIHYKSVCEACNEDYKKADAILETEAEEFDWLHTKGED